MSIITSEEQNCLNVAMFVQCYAFFNNERSWRRNYSSDFKIRSNLLKRALTFKDPTPTIKNVIILLTICYEPYYYLLIERISEILSNIINLRNINCQGLSRKTLGTCVDNEINCILHLSTQDIINCTRVLTNIVRGRRLNISCSKFIIIYMFKSINSYTPMDYIFSFFEDMVYKRK